MLQLIKLPLCEFFDKYIYWMLHDDAIYTRCKISDLWQIKVLQVLTHHEFEYFRGVFSVCCSTAAEWATGSSLLKPQYPFLLCHISCHSLYHNTWCVTSIIHIQPTCCAIGILSQIIVHKLITSSRTSKYRLLYHHNEAKIIAALHGCILINNRSFYDTHIYHICAQKPVISPKKHQQRSPWTISTISLAPVSN